MSREARSRAAKPRETKRRQPVSEGAFHRAGSAAAAYTEIIRMGQVEAAAQAAPKATCSASESRER